MHYKFKTSHKMLHKSFPLENPNIFVKCLRRNHTVAVAMSNGSLSTLEN